MLLLGDCLEQMKTLEADSVDAIVTDPPYGLSFMGKKWDYDVPSVEMWREALRVLKPGGHLLSFGGTRTYHRMVVAIEDAGFEIRDQIQWLYGSGFPKSHNLDGDHKGWGTALKPANEPICLARKPFKGTVASNVLKHGTGALNIDESRIGYLDNEKVQTFWNNRGGATINIGESVGSQPATGEGAYDPSKGRWPANVILDEQAAQMLDEQSGVSKSTGGRTVKRSGKYVDGKVSAPGVFTNDNPGFGDVGGASRFFYVAKASKRERNAGLEGMPEKGGSRNFNDGMEYRLQADGSKTSAKQLLSANHHPTVKPIKLMQYLIKLITPPGGTVLDPFMGSGSTGVAAKALGFKFIGIEMNNEYLEIAEKRIG